MVYNQGAYNRGAYNHGLTTASIKPLAIKGVGKLSTVRMRAGLRIRGTVSGKGTLSGRLRQTIRLRGNIEGRGSVSPAKLVVVQTVRPQAIRGVATLSSALLKLFGSEAINLRGIVLLPGQTLSINTDTLTVEINGQNAIKFWQTGSTPIMLSGSGELIYYDDNQERAAQMSLIFSDRWL